MASASNNAACAALSLLLREDPLLIRHGLTVGGGGGAAAAATAGGGGSAAPFPPTTTTTTTLSTDTRGANEEGAFSYAAALLHQDSSDASTGWMSSTGEVQRRAMEALAEVDRKLALVESLAERIGRERPEDVAGPLLRLHGYRLDRGGRGQGRKGAGNDGNDNGDDSDSETDDNDDDDNDNDDNAAHSLASMRDRADRLRRQGEMLEGVAKRVESSLGRGLGRMEAATSRLSRVLLLSSTLKMVMRLAFEARKVRGIGSDLDALAASSSSSSSNANANAADAMTAYCSVDVDLRDLTRAAASVAVMEGLLSHPDLGGGGLRAPPSSSSSSSSSLSSALSPSLRIDVVERMRPQAMAVASAVRRAAAGLLAEQQRAGGGSEGTGMGKSGAMATATAGGFLSPHRLGATLQVYYHLGELPKAAWEAAESGLAAAEKASAAFFNPAAVQRIVDQAEAEARVAVSGKGGGVGIGKIGTIGGGAGGGGGDSEDDPNSVVVTTAAIPTTVAAPPISSSSSGATDRRQVKRREEAAYGRALKRKLREKRTEAAQKWARGVADAALKVWTLQRVLARKSDLVARRTFLDVVRDCPVPIKFRPAEELLSKGASGTATTAEATTTATTTRGGEAKGAEGTMIKCDPRRTVKNFLFALFWNQMCLGLGARIRRLLRYQDGALVEDVAALYPTVRAAALDMVANVRDCMSSGSGVASAAPSLLLSSSSSSPSTGHGSSSMMGSTIWGGVGGVGGGGTLSPPQPLSSSSYLDDGFGSAAAASSAVAVSNGGIGVGILGGSAGLDNDALFDWAAPAAAAAFGGGVGVSDGDADAAAGAVAVGVGVSGAGADAWTRVIEDEVDDDDDNDKHEQGGEGTSRSAGGARSSAVGAAALASAFTSPEWIALQGGALDGGGGGKDGNDDDDEEEEENDKSGLHPLRSAFLDSSSDRLCAPLRFMFPEAVTVDENGAAIPVLPHLPSRYDLAKLDAAVRDELSLADPREGGGELGMTTMIAENVVDMVERFCAAAKGAMSDAGEGGYLRVDDGKATEALLHDMKVAGVMNTLASSLRSVPENTFVAPYRPAHSPQHEDAAALCRNALKPALAEIDSLVKSSILTPLSRAINRRVSSAISKMHQGTYLEETLDQGGGGSGGADSSSEGGGGGVGGFVQRHLADVYESVASDHLSKLPPEYASIVASTVASYSIYAFVSHVSLVRPMGEVVRLRITQDLADFELCLEQLVFKGGSTATLGQMDGGRPYAELRAVRTMLFWTGLDEDGEGGAASAAAKPSDLAKSMLRETWVRDVRPSTVFHFLFSFAPPLLSSPHHAKRMSAEEYVSTLVRLDGTVDEGETSAWMTVTRCCESYQQRESVDAGGGGGGIGGSGGGDRRVAAILMILGPELLRRRGL